MLNMTELLLKINDVLKENQISLAQKDIDDNFIELLYFAEGKEYCQKCTGIENCKAEIPGMTTKIEFFPNGGIYFSKGTCSFETNRQKIKRRERLLSSSRIPRHLKTKTFENYKINQHNKKAYELAKKLAVNPESKGLILTGNTGTGKTHLAGAIMNYRLTNGQETVFCTVPELLTDIRRVIKNQQETSELIEIIKNTELLVLDDLGAERVTPWVMEQLFIIINSRILDNKQIVATTNYEPKELIERMTAREGKFVDDLPGRRIVSRLSEMCEWVAVGGSDMRLTRERGA